MTSFVGSEALLRENPAAKGVKWPLSLADDGQVTEEMAAALTASAGCRSK